MTIEIDTELLAALFQKVNAKEPGDLWQPLGRLAEEKGDAASAAGMRVLSDVMSYYAANDERHAPYRACVVMNGKRSAEPDDLTDEELDALAGALPNLLLPVAKARVADVLWLRKRNPEFAVQAIGAYLQ